MIIQNNSIENLQDIEKEKQKGPILIWFYATWCGHCNDMKEEWNKLDNNHPEGIKLGKIESSNMPNYNKSMGEKELLGYPTLRLYDKGNLIKEYEGERNYESIYNFVDSYLNKNKKKTKNNLVLIKAKRGNVINKKLVNKIISNGKKSKKSSKKKTVKEKTNNHNVSLKKKNKKKKSQRKKKRTKKLKGGHNKNKDDNHQG